MSGPIHFSALKSAFLLAATLVAATAFAQKQPAPGGSAQLPEAAENLITAQVGWDIGVDKPAGSHLRFVKLNETTVSGQHMFRYRVFADGLKDAGGPYLFFVWKIDTPLDQMAEIWKTTYTNRKGLLMVKEPTAGQQDADTVDDDSELDVAVAVAKGEPVRFVLRSQDMKTMVTGTLIPVPNQAANNGCRLSSVLVFPEAQALLIYADGFPPNTVLPLNSVSEGEVNTNQIRINAQGHGVVVELPSVTGKDSGTVRDTVTAKGCTVTVETPWGKSSYRPQ
jgi:hypothetical protein